VACFIAVDDVEFRLSRGYNARLLWRGCVALALAVVLFVASLNASALKWVALLPLVYSVCNLGLYLWRGRFCTRLTPQGIEVHRYFNKFVPWQSIRDIETLSYERVADVPVANLRDRTVSPRGRGPRVQASVRVVRTSGHRLRLPAPMVMAVQGDPDFDNKVRLIRTRWQEAVTGSAAHLDRPTAFS
jgi:hypothetical protein